VKRKLNISTNGLSLQNILFSFKGRISRSKFAVHWFGVGVVFALASLVLLNASKSSVTHPTYRDVAIAGFFLVLLIFATWANFALMVKRLHDCDAPVWLIFIPLVLPFLAGLLYERLPAEFSGAVLFLSWAFNIWLIGFTVVAKGTEVPNRHGPDPLKGR